ncbi:TPA: LacI family DNA-binding transcriptional regulator [Streptococcus suis]
MKKYTIKDIAEIANVSIATVSNVINKKYNKVSQKNIDKINAIIEELEYSPNLYAKSLISNQSRLITVLFYSEGEQFNFSDPFVGELLEGIEKIAKNTDYYIVLHNISTVDELEILKKSSNYAGHIAVGFSDSLINQIIDYVDEPIVFVDSYLTKETQNRLENERIYWVNSADYDLSKQVTQLIIDRNIKQIAFLSYEFDPNLPSVIERRWEGAKDAISIHRDILLDRYTINQIELLIGKIEQYQAIIVTADLLAMQLLAGIRQTQRNPKGNLSSTNQQSEVMVARLNLPDIFSFDNISYIQYIENSINTIDLYQKEKGELALSILVGVLQENLPKGNFFTNKATLIINKD